MGTFCYGLKQGLKNIWQNRLFSLAAIGTIVACLFLLGLFFALISNFQNIIRHAENSVGVTVFFDEGISEKKMKKIGKEIEACEGVERIKFISAAQAWEDFQEEMYEGDTELSEAFGKENPLKDSASYEVYLRDVSAQKTVISVIKEMDGVRKVNSADTVTNSMGRFNLLVTYISVTMILLLLLVSVFLISTAVATGIRVRSSEISIIKYIGATDLFVRLPFVIEGVVIGMIGAMMPLILLWFMYEKLISFILTHFSALSDWLTFVSAGRIFKVLIPLSLLVGVGIGFVGSSLSVRKHLRIVR